jgi:hypothetical protein
MTNVKMIDSVGFLYSECADYHYIFLFAFLGALEETAGH